MRMIYREGNIKDLSNLRELGGTSYSGFSKVLTDGNWKKMNSFLDDGKGLVELIHKGLFLFLAKIRK